jgi:redox-sensitive bicupin YhaK (pirin superfamily)
MITILKAEERGKTKNEWLESYHSFSFGDFFDPDRMSFRALRVLNDDRVAPGRGFPMHGHREMEIVSYVVRGQMEHKDSLGNGSVIKRGDVQRMSAGTGIQHGESNPGPEPLHLIQVWLVPNEKGLEPSYEQAEIDMDAMRRGWVALAGPEGSYVRVHADAVFAATVARTGESRTLEFSPGRAGYLFVARGGVRFHGNELKTGDAAAIEDEPSLSFEALMESEVLAFDLG